MKETSLWSDGPSSDIKDQDSMVRQALKDQTLVEVETCEYKYFFWAV
jgi:hypothetical protein